MEKNWSVYGNVYKQTEVSNQISKLDVGVFILEQNDFGFYLSRTSDSFLLPNKVYGMETSFINRVIKTYINTNTNLGVILNGLKGTGKTVVAKHLANIIKLPVIIIPKDYDNIEVFLNSIQENVIVFIDEYEKIYGYNDDKLLSLMDGVLSNEFRKIWLLTTNELEINENLLQRPSRIRYIKKFGDLTLNHIIEIVDDVLIDKKYRDDTIEMISTLNMITVDIVKAICDEVNIHNESPYDFKDVFNLESDNVLYNVYILDGDLKDIKLKHQSAKINISDISSVDGDFNINNRYIGVVKSIINPLTFVVENEDNEDSDTDKFDVIYRLEKVQKIHNSFKPTF